MRIDAVMEIITATERMGEVGEVGGSLKVKNALAIIIIIYAGYFIRWPLMQPPTFYLP